MENFKYREKILVKKNISDEWIEAEFIDYEVIESKLYAYALPDRSPSDYFKYFKRDSYDPYEDPNIVDSASVKAKFIRFDPNNKLFFSKNASFLVAKYDEKNSKMNVIDFASSIKRVYRSRKNFYYISANSEEKPIDSSLFFAPSDLYIDYIN